RGALDGGLVDTLAAVDVVGAAVRGDRAHPGGLRPRVEAAEVVDDVVLDERVRCPAVQRQVAVAAAAPAAGVVHGVAGAGVPTLAYDGVVDAAPLDAVVA